MTTKTGRITIQFSDSRLDGQLLLRRNGVPTPAGAATNFLAGKGIQNNDIATVTGSEEPSGAEIALFIQSASKAAAPGLAAAGFAAHSTVLEAPIVATSTAAKRARRPKRKTKTKSVKPVRAGRKQSRSPSKSAASSKAGSKKKRPIKKHKK